MLPSRSALINVMEKAVRAAARGLVRDFGEVENLQVSRKGPADFVSQADLKAEKILRAELNRARPSFGMLMEEGGSVIGSDVRNRWIVDPLDGTTNFLHGLPHFAISVALERDKEIVAAMVYAPILDELFWAERGQGAYLNRRRLRVSGRNNMADGLIATGAPFMGHGQPKQFLGELEQIMPVSAGIRRFGSAALDLAYVAAGRFDGFWERDLKIWDVAAGLLLVRESGGMVSNFSGQAKPLWANKIECPEILAANETMHAILGQHLHTAARLCLPL